MSKGYLENLKQAKEEAERFIKKAEVAINHLETDEWAAYRSIHVASAKRASMDLTRALVFVRKSK